MPLDAADTPGGAGSGPVRAPAGSAGPVVCFGEMMLRLSPPGATPLRMADSLDLHVAGAEANVAMALAALGTPARMLTALPDGPLGDRALAALRMAGADTRFVVRGAGRMGLYYFEPSVGLRSGRVTYDRAGSLFAAASAGRFDFAAALSGAALLHLSGITPALGPGGMALARAAIAAADAAGVPVSFDGNWRGALWAAWDGDPRALLGELVGAATILFGNHRDIALLTGQSFPGTGPARRRAAADAAFAAFPRLGLIASTARDVHDAAHHSYAARVDTPGGGAQTDTVAITGIVDRIGTGDAFVAGVLHRHLAGADPAAAAAAGLALAALKHGVPGDQILAEEADLAAFEPQGGDVRR